MIEQNPAQTDEFPPVIAGIADALHAAVIEQHPSRTLDLQDMKIDRIIDPEQHRRLAVQRAGLDFGAAGNAAADTRIGRLVGGAAQQRDMIFRRLMARAM